MDEATRNTMTQTIADIYAKLLPLIGKEFLLPITKNKGLPGLFLEECLGIPHTSRCLDCSDGELKLFPVKQRDDGSIVPKETIAITMLSTDDLRAHGFQESRCCQKMRRMLVVPYSRTEDMIQFLNSRIVTMDSEEFSDVYSTIESDYNLIRTHYLETGILTSTMGTFLQTRTKGAGHGSTSRAFYLRPAFLRRCIL
jgi:hypothetical protein